jgi:L-threonylcarbamoyladenylate synthase
MMPVSHNCHDPDGLNDNYDSPLPVPMRPPPWAIQRAAQACARGGIVAYPTEGIYGLGCSPRSAGALRRLLWLKGRRPGKGFIVIAASIRQLRDYVRLPAGARGALIRASWPGPATWVLPVRKGISPWLTGGRGTLAVRVTAHPPARALCRLAGPLVSTSANRSGRPPAIDPATLRQRLFVDYLLRGPLGGHGGPTEIRDGRTGRILRPGASSPSDRPPRNGLIPAAL